MSGIVLLSITPAIHEHLTGEAGSHADALAALSAAGRHRVRTAVHRANMRELATLAQWLVARRDRVHSWQLQWGGEPQRPGLAPTRLGMAAPYMLHAATAARQQGLGCEVQGLPTCALGPHTQLRATDERSPAALEARFPAPCAGCAARTNCCGVAPAYAERFAMDIELKRIAPRTPR